MQPQLQPSINLAGTQVHLFDTVTDVPEFTVGFRPAGMYRPAGRGDGRDEDRASRPCEAHATVIVDTAEQRVSRWGVPYWCARAHTIATGIGLTLVFPARLVERDLVAGDAVLVTGDMCGTIGPTPIEQTDRWRITHPDAAAAAPGRPHRATLLDWCYGFYNHHRRHSTIGMTSPINYESAAALDREAA